jgi:hypothetical protein
MDVKMFTSVFFALLLSDLIQSHRLISLDGLVVMLIIGLALYFPKKGNQPGGS